MADRTNPDEVKHRCVALGCPTEIMSSATQLMNVIRRSKASWPHPIVAELLPRAQSLAEVQTSSEECLEVVLSHRFSGLCFTTGRPPSS